MQTYTLLRGVIAASLAVVTFVGTLAGFAPGAQASLLTASDAPIVSYTPEGASSQSVTERADLTGPGELRLGHFGVARLGGGTRVRVASLTIDRATQSVTAAELQLVQGRVWIANFLIGSSLSVSDQLVSAKTLGGAFVFEHTATTDKTVATIAGSRGMTMITQLSDEATTYLPADTTTQITQTVAADPQSVTTATQGDIGTYVRDQEARDAFHLAELAGTLSAAIQPDAFPLLTQLHEIVAVLPTAQARLASHRTGAALHQLIEGATQHIAPGSEIASFLPFTQLAATRTLSSDLLAQLTRLSAIEPILATAAKHDPLRPHLAAYQQLLLAPHAKAEAATTLLARVPTSISADTEGAELPLRQLSSVITQAIHSRQTDLAGHSLRTLAEALQSSDALEPQLVAELSEQGLTAKQQLTYLATLPADATFDEQKFNRYLAMQTSAGVAHAAAEVVPAEEPVNVEPTESAEPVITEATTEQPAPRKIRRPRPSFDRFVEAVAEPAPVVSTKAPEEPKEHVVAAEVPEAAALSGSVLDIPTKPQHRPTR